MDAAEFGLWLAAYQRSPWGEYRTDLQAGIIASTVANVNSTQRFVPADFMPYLEKGKRYASEDETMQFLQGFM